MGYCTSYKFSVIEGGDEEKLISEFREFSEEAMYAIDEYGDTECECKWYDSNEELVKFSKKNPDVIFCLEGIGEESGDAWKIYAKSGHIQVCRAELVYPEFDKGKLLADIRGKKIDNLISG